MFHYLRWTVRFMGKPSESEIDLLSRRRSACVMLIFTRRGDSASLNVLVMTEARGVINMHQYEQSQQMKS